MWKRFTGQQYLGINLRISHLMINFEHIMYIIQIKYEDNHLPQ